MVLSMGPSQTHLESEAYQRGVAGRAVQTENANSWLAEKQSKGTELSAHPCGILPWLELPNMMLLLLSVSALQTLLSSHRRQGVGVGALQLGLIASLPPYLQVPQASDKGHSCHPGTHSEVLLSFIGILGDVCFMLPWLAWTHITCCVLVQRGMAKKKKKCL